MEKHPFRKYLILLIVLSCGLTSYAQVDNSDQRLGLPGDNFNLAAALDVFRQSPTLEAFEGAINSDSTKINNLDLNNDGKVDYVRVVDRPEENVHTIVLQIDINEKETQDVAVIFVRKEGDDVTVQVVGDEELYGKNYILEPASATARKETPNPAYQGQPTTVVTNNYYTENNYYNSPPSYAPDPSSWMIVSFIYSPVYRPWRSPWYWGYYPGWWTPWSAFYWDHYYNYWYYQRPWNGWWYWRAQHYYFEPWYGHYRMERRTSPVFTNARRDGVFQNTYNNPRPEARPAQRANFPSHHLPIEKNPAIARPGSGARPIEVTPAKTRPEESRPGPAVKPDSRDREPVVQPDRSKGQPSAKPKPIVRPEKPVTKPSTKPSTKPAKKPAVQPSQPSKQPGVRPSRPPRTNAPSPTKSPRTSGESAPEKGRPVK